MGRLDRDVYRPGFTSSLLKNEDQTSLVLGIGVDERGTDEPRMPFVNESAKCIVIGQHELIQPYALLLLLGRLDSAIADRIHIAAQPAAKRRRLDNTSKTTFAPNNRW